MTDTNSLEIKHNRNDNGNGYSSNDNENNIVHAYAVDPTYNKLEIPCT